MTAGASGHVSDIIPRATTRPPAVNPAGSARRTPGPGAVPAAPPAAPPAAQEHWRDRVLKDDLVRETMARFEAHVSDIMLASETGAAGTVEPPPDPVSPTEEGAPLFDLSHDVEEQD